VKRSPKSRGVYSLAEQLNARTAHPFCPSNHEKFSGNSADNKLALNAGWDNDLLKIELEDLKVLDFDLAVC
jgi:hypothetical protein